MNRIEIFGADERLMATIIQKKTWIGSRVDREILLEPGPYGKSNTYTAHFTWNDASVNVRPNMNLRNKKKPCLNLKHFLKSSKPIGAASLLQRSSLTVLRKGGNQITCSNFFVTFVHGIRRCLSPLCLPE